MAVLHPLVAPLERTRAGYLGSQQYNNRPIYCLRFPGDRLHTSQRVFIPPSDHFLFYRSAGISHGADDSYLRDSRRHLPHPMDAPHRPARTTTQLPAHGFTPLPAYNEPPEVVAETLRSLAALDYPNYEVLVIDNNTPDSRTWRLLENTCGKLGPKFHFMHLDKWRGTNPAH